MAKRFILALAAVLASAVMFAQTGGVKGTVVDRDGRQPVEGARLVLLQGAERLAEVSSAQDGTFMIPNLKDGMYTLLIEAPDYLETQV